MWGTDVRLQPSRPPPPFDPVVEAWLESLPPPASKPSRKELRQWKLTDYHGLGRSVFVTCAILRSVSLTIALTVTGVTASIAARRQGPFEAQERLVPALVVCPIVAVWNLAEFTVAYVSRDGGVPPNVHVVVDSLLFLGMATAMGTLLVDVICGVTDFGSTFHSVAEEIASVCLLVVLMVIHSFLLFFFICNCIERARRKPKPAANHSAIPRYAEAAAHRPFSGAAAAAAADPPAAQGILKLGPIITAAVEVSDFEMGQGQGAPGAGMARPRETSVHPPPSAAASERAALAQAMSGLWDVGGDAPYHPNHPRGDEGATNSETGLHPPAKVRYM